MFPVAEGEREENRNCTDASENEGTDHKESRMEMRVLMKRKCG